MKPVQPIFGLCARFFRNIIKLHILAIAFSRYKSISMAFKSLLSLKRMRFQATGNTPILKFFRIGHKYFWSLASPGWPSVTFRKFLINELNRVSQANDQSQRLTIVVFGITTECPLNCEHCYAGNYLNKPDYLTFHQLKELLTMLQNRGVSIIQWSGGEPLCRFDDMIQLTRQSKRGTDFWVLTSGVGLTNSKAREMRAAGITGVNISLDHWNPEEHNRFRNFSQAFTWVERAIHNARENGLVVAVSLCATRAFVNKENLNKYFRLAKEMGVHFVQILEARAIGHYSGKDVLLTKKQYDLLDNYFISLNSHITHRYMPIVNYYGYHQRRIGCYGSGERFMYIDPYGDIFPCPFSEMKIGNAITDRNTINTKLSICDETCDRYVLSSHMNK
jgi:MoaA/NifB/PqqE/SkfB family radical SAM enzyme